MFKKLLLLSLVAIVAVGLLGSGWFGARDGLKSVGQRVEQREFVSINAINHAPLDTLLRRYVDADGYVDYSSLKANTEDRLTLQRYLESLSFANPELPATKSNQLAFWINAYNAVTIEGILHVYPTNSIRDHTAKLVGYNIWKDLKLIVGSRQYSLDEIEHQVLRKMGEPRIHFAIVCASVGCPRLKNEAYEGQRLQQQLDENAVDFFSRAQNLQWEERTRTLLLSQILNWFGSDFGADQNAKLTTISPYFPISIRQAIDQGKIRIRYQSYDWKLNDQKSKPSAR